MIKMGTIEYRAKCIEHLKNMIAKAKDYATAVIYMNELSKLESLPTVDDRKVIFCNNYARLGKSLR